MYDFDYVSKDRGSFKKIIFVLWSAPTNPEIPPPTHKNQMSIITSSEPCVSSPPLPPRPQEPQLCAREEQDDVRLHQGLLQVAAGRRGARAAGARETIQLYCIRARPLCCFWEGVCCLLLTFLSCVLFWSFLLLQATEQSEIDEEEVRLRVQATLTRK